MARFICCSQDNIWATGETEQSVLAKAATYGGENIEGLDTVPATDRLVAAVEHFTEGHPVYPEDMHWEIKQGVADLCS